MPKVTLYTTRFCPYCAMAKRLLTQKGGCRELYQLDDKGELDALLAG